MRLSGRRLAIVGIAGALTVGSVVIGAANADVSESSAALSGEDGRAKAQVLQESFNSLNKRVWSCEYTCPTVSGGKARYRLSAGDRPNRMGSWSKVGYKPKRFTKGEFSIRFSLSERPTKQAVWWGLALWDDGPAADGSQFNEINFGYTTNQSYTNTQLRFESAKRGKYHSLKVDTGVNLYDGKFHTGTLKYDRNSVQFYLDGRLLKVIKDRSVIPTDPMKLVVGPRLVTGSAPLNKQFTQTVDWVWAKY